uniref:ribonuclease H n=1 Tax=Hucho hucho TaxID=62062 RepID=A0A4W5LSB5_9TELE
MDLNQYIRMSISIGNLLVDRSPIQLPIACESSMPFSHPPRSNSPEPMQLVAQPLSRRLSDNRGYVRTCASIVECNHLLTCCPIRPPQRGDHNPSTSARVSTSTFLNITKRQFGIPALLSANGVTQFVEGLVDSGAAGNLIDEQLAQQLRFKLIPVNPPFRINALDRQPLRTGLVTESITLQIGLLHSEVILLLVLSSPKEPLILGHPWLSLHNPSISWRQGELLSWSLACFKNCFSLPCRATSIERSESAIPTHIPPVYAQFLSVFSKKKASILPPHRPEDCAIDLLPASSPPKGRIYPLSIPENEAMDTYIEEALNMGFIRPSTSPAVSSFFFVKKKDGSLHPCIDYRPLNDFTMKNHFPLPLIQAALEQAGKDTIFSKLDLHSAYNLVRIRSGNEWKTAFITARDHYEYLVMPYGLTNAPAVFQSFMN